MVVPRIHHFLRWPALFIQLVAAVWLSFQPDRHLNLLFHATPRPVRTPHVFFGSAAQARTRSYCPAPGLETPCFGGRNRANPCHSQANCTCRAYQAMLTEQWLQAMPEAFFVGAAQHAAFHDPGHHGHFPLARFIASWVNVRVGTPVAPFTRWPFAEVAVDVPAMSRCTQSASSANSRKSMAAVIDPA